METVLHAVVAPPDTFSGINNSFHKHCFASSTAAREYITTRIGDPDAHRVDPMFLNKADINRGSVNVARSKYVHLNTRICRPVGLTATDKSRVISHMMKHLGNAFDLKNVIALARYLMRMPPVPTRFRSQMIALGSSDPTHALFVVDREGLPKRRFSDPAAHREMRSGAESH
ncbi:MAG: hypothetical protein ACFCUJ_09710 [Thiotrichales bacterium]